MLRAHPSMPFECTYHFICVGPQAFVLLDVIRSPRRNSLRFFFVDAGKLVHHEVIDETTTGGSALAPTADRIHRSDEPLTFDLSFVVKTSACAVAPVNPLRLFAITAKDHPHVHYNGTINYQTKAGTRQQWTLSDAPGTISQHYGRTLPEYLYFTTYFDGRTPQLVGAVSRVDTALGFRITSSYVTASDKGGDARTVLSLRPAWHATDDGALKVHSRHGDVTLELGAESMAHNIDRQLGKTWFNARIWLRAVSDAPLPGLVETRGAGWTITGEHSSRG